MRRLCLVLRNWRSFVVLRFAAATQDDGNKRSGEVFTVSERSEGAGWRAAQVARLPPAQVPRYARNDTVACSAGAA